MKLLETILIKNKLAVDFQLQIQIFLFKTKVFYSIGISKILLKTFFRKISTFPFKNLVVTLWR
jgi:hypothetical protein